MRERATANHPSIQRFIAISRYVSQQLQEHHNIPTEKIELIPNGSELPEVTAQERIKHRQQIRSAFQIAEDSIALLFLAQHSSRLKGIEPLLLASQKLLGQGKDITLILAGHIPYRDQLLIARLGIRRHVRMVGPTNQIAQLLSASDITVMPSYFDPSSKIAIESLMMGVPVVTSRYNGACDFLLEEAGKTSGCLVADPANTDELTAAIAAYMDPASRNACNEKAAQWRDKLAMSRHVDQLESLMQQTIGS